MDGISSAASVLTLVELAGKTITYIKQVKNAPQEKQHLLKLLIQSKGTLHTLSDLIEYVEEEDCATTIRSLGGSDGPLSQYQDILERIVSRLDINCHKGSLQHIVNRLKWPFTRKEVEEITTVLEKLKSMFVIATTNDHVRLSIETHKEVQKANLQIHHMNTVLDKRLISLSPRQKAMVESLSPLRLCNDLDESHIKWLTIKFGWFLEHDSFKLWERGAGTNRTLALIDGPGRGTSALCQIVHYYLELWMEDNPDSCAVYLELDIHEAAHLYKASLLSKIIALVFLARPHLVCHLSMLRRRQGVLPFDVGIALLQAARADLDQLYIVLDGLYIGNNEDMCQLLEGLQSVRPPLNLFLASRPVQNLEAENRAMRHGHPPAVASLRGFLIHDIEKGLEAMSSARQFLEAGNESITAIANNIATASYEIHPYTKSQLKRLATAETSEIFRRMLSCGRDYGEEMHAIEFDNIMSSNANKAALAKRVFAIMLKHDHHLTLKEVRDALPDEISLAAICMGLNQNPSYGELIRILRACCKSFIHVFDDASSTDLIIFATYSGEQLLASKEL